MWNNWQIYKCEVDKCDFHFHLTFLCIFILESITYETKIRNNLLEIKRKIIIMSANMLTHLDNIKEFMK